MKKPILFVLLVIAAFALQGCSTGYNRVTVSTISNVGVDLETAPPKMEAAVSSYEGMMMPIFEGGQAVPVISGTSTKGGKLTKFFAGRSSTLAAGDAAYNMGYLYADCNQSVNQIPSIPDVELTQKPGLVPGPGTVKPAIVTTNTMFGVKLAFSKHAPLALSSMKIGFNRQEEVSAPILVEPGSRADMYVAGAPSLVATMDYSIDLKGEGDERLQFAQYFATGEAANSLSLRSDVRQALFKRITPYMRDSFCQDDYETKVR